MRHSRPYLFSDHELRGVVEAQLRKMRSEIEQMDENRLLNTNVTDMVSYLVEKYRIEPIVLKEEGITVDQVETQIDVSGQRDRYISDRSQPFYIKGTSNRFFVPFSGESELFKCQPSTFTTAPPLGVIETNELLLKYDTTDHDAEKIRSTFDRDLSEIKRYLSWIERDLKGFNSSLTKSATDTINQRKEQILANKGLAASLGFPLREREGAPKTYKAPEVKRKPPIHQPAASTAPYVPEPSLDNREYEHILSVIDNMVLVMERSPQAFSGMAEEDIRQHFLVQLNGHYEGQATGETFNFEGKTDILIRVESRNIFIAECKFWRGPKSLLDSIDQILGYASWRDTKTALLVFNRNKNLSSVLEKVPQTLESHKNFKRFAEYARESGWRVILRNKDDEDKELVLTVHIYEVPIEIGT